MNKNPYWHQSLLQSTFIEWYLQSEECFAKKKPQFKIEFDYVYVVAMWADYGCSIFWNNGISIGEIAKLSIFNLNFDFSDIKGLNDWYDEFIRLADNYRKVFTTTEEKKDAILEKIKQWHINGFKLAQEIRKRLPTNVILIYEQSWDVAAGQLYFSRDYGRIILDPRKIIN